MSGLDSSEIKIYISSLLTEEKLDSFSLPVSSNIQFCIESVYCTGAYVIDFNVKSIHYVFLIEKETKNLRIEIIEDANP